jgi:hypothetical protein
VAPAFHKRVFETISKATRIRAEVAFLFVGLFAATFLAWRDEHNHVEQLRTENARLAGELDAATSNSKHKDAIANQIAQFVDRANALTQSWMSSDDTEKYKTDVIKWANEVYNYLNLNLGQSYAIQFKNAHGNAFMGSPSGHSVEGGGISQEIHGKNDFLSGIIDELRR